MKVPKYLQCYRSGDTNAQHGRCSATIACMHEIRTTRYWGPSKYNCKDLAFWCIGSPECVASHPICHSIRCFWSSGPLEVQHEERRRHRRHLQLGPWASGQLQGPRKYFQHVPSSNTAPCWHPSKGQRSTKSLQSS